MKKVIVGLVVASLFSSNVFADHRYEPPMRYDGYRDYGYGHRGGGVNPWPFIAGAVVGGIIVNEANRSRDVAPRYITVCRDIALFDSSGNFVKTDRICRQEYVQ